MPIHNTGGSQGGRAPAPVSGGVNTQNPAGTQKTVEGGKTLHSSGSSTPSSRPPLPRNTGGINNDTTTYAAQKSETLQKSSLPTVKGSEREIQKGGIPGSRSSEREVQKGGIPESKGAQPRISPTTPSTNVTENKGGNISSGKVSVSGSDVSYSHTGGGESISKGGTNSVTMVSGEKGRLHSGRDKDGVSKEVYSDSHGELHFGEKSSQYEHETQGRGYTQAPGRVHTAESKVNHEYRNGRFNPAAANKKVKTSYYQKDISPLGNAAEKDRRRKRREENGKHKR